MRALLRLVLLAATPASAHDFWIEPSTWTPSPGVTVALRLRVGRAFVGDALPRDPRLQRRFAVASATRERPVQGMDGFDPAGWLRPEAGEGTLVVAYESGPSLALVKPALLDAYLRDEGLDDVAPSEELRRRGARDAFSRHAKALLQVPGVAPGACDVPLGLTLELVPETNPYALVGGGRLPLRLLLRGEPVEGARVAAIPRLRPLELRSARTDADGRVRLDLPSGEWLVKAVRLTADEDPRVADWRSYWASLTFRIPEAPR